MNKKIKQIREAIKDRLNVGDEVFDVKSEGTREEFGPYAKQLLCYFIKVIYPLRSYRTIAKLTGLNYGSVYYYDKKTKEDVKNYPEIRNDVDFLFYRLGIKNIYKDKLVKDLKSEVFINDNGQTIARLIKETTGLDITYFRGLKNQKKHNFTN